MGLTVEKVVGNTDAKYKILTAGSKFDIGFGEIVLIKYGEMLYKGKMHSSSKGRIDGLGKFYAENNINVGDKLLLTYESIEGIKTITIVKISEESSYETEEEDFIVINYEQEIPIVNEEKYVAEIENLGLDFDELWTNVPRKSFMKPRYCQTESAACNEDVVVIKLYEKLYVLDRKTGEYKVKDIVFKGKFTEYLGNITCSCIEDNRLYAYDFSNVYEIDYQTGEAEIIYKVRNSGTGNKELSNVVKCNGRVCYCVTSSNADYKITSVSLMIDDMKVSIPKKFYGDCECRILGYAGRRLLLKGENYFIYDMDTYNMLSLFEYTFEHIEKNTIIYQHIYNLKDKEDLLFKNLYAINLDTHTVTFRDFKEFTGNRYVENSLIVIRNEKIGRRNGVIRKKSYEKLSHHCGTSYRDVAGHEIAVSLSYDFVYRRNDDSIQVLFYTNGSCVPETFSVIDGRTAFVKVREWEYSIVDFASNRKYIIQRK